MKKILPLGSVVTLNNGSDNRIMIVSRASIVMQNGEETKFDFGGTYIPSGIINSNELLFFNSEDIKTIDFLGFIDANEQRFAYDYKKFLENEEQENQNSEKM